LTDVRSFIIRESSKYFEIELLNDQAERRRRQLRCKRGGRKEGKGKERTVELFRKASSKKRKRERERERLRISERTKGLL